MAHPFPNMAHALPNMAHALPNTAQVRAPSCGSSRGCYTRRATASWRACRAPLVEATRGCS
eukprot:260289-Prymnesium_polylepis.1